ncbi:DUF4245 domain-containing protein [Blastococcus sp. MG754426]|uniref:DUF4245 domain-containing protein n=1 Tax=unclassified Blastococcus TaxID=2619396 RepID=UPI001EF04D75|nr:MULTISPECIES: DUF4245 domain-containing protein [unclassified Blastococcus]MCF6509204.1 DUF4245 domain-containing protein [Blastococcus sp. MG754426]MCF6513772.1 DUF4245 domain-containing protein [Blastococcus sp. MG754427]
MTGSGPSSQHPPRTEDPAGPGAEVLPPPVSAVERANRLSAANMLRSLLPLVVICLLIVWWQAFRSNPDDPVIEVDPTSTLRLAEARAVYPLLIPALGEDYRPTSVRTDAGTAPEGSPVTVQLGYVTPAGDYAGYVVTDDADAEALDVLAGAAEEGVVEIDGEEWTESTTQRGETALTRVADGVTVVVTGSAGDGELREVAGAVEPFTG